MHLKLIILSLIASICASCSADRTMEMLELDESIRLNQIGYLPDQSKIAIVLSEESLGQFFVWGVEQKKVVYEGVAVRQDSKTFSGKTAWKVDFSTYSEEGTYELGLSGFGKSYPFTIEKDVFSELSKASLKAFYFQRMSTDLPE